MRNQTYIRPFWPQNQTFSTTSLYIPYQLDLSPRHLQLQQRLWSQPLLNRLFTLWKTSFTGKTYRFQGFQTNFLRFYDIFGDLSDLNRSFWQHIRPKLRFKIRKGPISDLGPTDQTRVAALHTAPMQGAVWVHCTRTAWGSASSMYQVNPVHCMG